MKKPQTINQPTFFISLHFTHSLIYKTNKEKKFFLNIYPHRNIIALYFYELYNNYVILYDSWFLVCNNIYNNYNKRTVRKISGCDFVIVINHTYVLDPRSSRIHQSWHNGTAAEQPLISRIPSLYKLDVHHHWYRTCHRKLQQNHIINTPIN